MRLREHARHRWIGSSYCFRSKQWHHQGRQQLPIRVLVKRFQRSTRAFSSSVFMSGRAVREQQFLLRPLHLPGSCSDAADLHCHLIRNDNLFRDEGIVAFWKGNGTNIIRIFPYSAAQLSANDFYKRALCQDGDLTVAMRLTAGALAGMTATALTHPLDTIRLRLALPQHPYNGVLGWKFVMRCRKRLFHVPNT